MVTDTTRQFCHRIIRTFLYKAYTSLCTASNYVMKIRRVKRLVLLASFTIRECITARALLHISIIRRRGSVLGWLSGLCSSRHFGLRDERLWSTLAPSSSDGDAELQQTQPQTPEWGHVTAQADRAVESTAVRRGQSRRESPLRFVMLRPLLKQNTQKRLSVEAWTWSVLPQGFHFTKHNVHANSAASVGKWIKPRPFAQAFGVL